MLDELGGKVGDRFVDHFSIHRGLAIVHQKYWMFSLLFVYLALFEPK